MLLSIGDLNRMAVSDFTASFGDVAEHSPWIAERAAGARPFACRDGVVDAFAAALRGAAREERLAVLRAHPDLAGRAAVAGALTGTSAAEQAGAGLDRLTPAEFERFTALNAAYRERFGIPFIFAVKGASAATILAAFEERRANEAGGRARERDRPCLPHHALPHRGSGRRMTTGADAAARVLRGRTVSFGDDPRFVGPDRAMRGHADGAVVVGGRGRILWHGAFADLPREHAEAPCDRHDRAVILPGLIDAHVHFPQHRMLAAPAHDLLEWLDRFAFPEEARYACEDHAAAAAECFLDKLVSHGTTSALVFSSVHGQAAGCLFRAARRRGLCLITGATMMDRNAPPAVTRDAAASARESAELIASWHGVERLRYALTVRFAVTSSEAQLRLAGELLADHPRLPAPHASLGERRGDRSGAAAVSLVEGLHRCL